VSLSVIRVIRASLKKSNNNKPNKLFDYHCDVYNRGVNGKTNSKNCGADWRSNPALLLEVSDLTNHTDVLSRAQAKHACGNDSKRGEERKGAGTCMIERPGVTEVATQYHSTMQQEPKANRHKNRSHHAYSPFSPSLHLHLLSLPVASVASLSQEHRRTHSLVHRQAFNVFWRMSILRDVFEEREGFRRTRVTAGECSPNVS
jgi:hypothetical protein